MSTVKATIEKPINQPIASLAFQVDAVRKTTIESLDERRRSEMGQFMTPAPVAKLMASMFNDLTGEIHLLDAGAGVGSLTAAFVEEACNRKQHPDSISINAYEPEKMLAEQLELTTSSVSYTHLTLPTTSRV